MKYDVMDEYTTEVNGYYYEDSTTNTTRYRDGPVFVINIPPDSLVVPSTSAELGTAKLPIEPTSTVNNSPTEPSENSASLIQIPLKPISESVNDDTNNVEIINSEYEFFKKFESFFAPIIKGNKAKNQKRMTPSTTREKLFNSSEETSNLQKLKTKVLDDFINKKNSEHQEISKWKNRYISKEDAETLTPKPNVFPQLLQTGIKIYPPYIKLMSNTKNEAAFTTRKIKQYICSVCKLSFIDETAVVKHGLMKHFTLLTDKDIFSETIVTYKCNLCGESFSDRKQLRLHVVNIHMDHDFITHVKNTNKKRPRQYNVKCNMCNFKFSTELELFKHKRKSHTQKETGTRKKKISDNSQILSKIECLVEKDGSDSKSVKSKVTALKTVFLKCPKCSKTFTTHNDVRVHYNTHFHDVPQLQCFYCGDSFAHENEMMCHVSLHEMFNSNV